MNREPYGKKCKCDHLESQHVLQKHKFSEPNAIPEMGLFFTHPPGMVKEPTYLGCKICSCKKFDPEKGRWPF